MRLNKRGFAVTSIIYSMLVLFLALVLLIMSNLASRKTLFDKEKNDLLNKLDEKFNSGFLCELISGWSEEVGSKYVCDFGDGKRFFYVLESDENSDDISLIMDRNYDRDSMEWCESGAYQDNCGADGLTSKLNEIAGSWTRLKRNQITLPTAEQIVKADEKTYNGPINTYYLSNEWLYEYPGNSNWGSSAPWGYWTSTYADTMISSGVFVNAWGRVDYDAADLGSTGFGVRPVVVIPKDRLFGVTPGIFCTAIAPTEQKIWNSTTNTSELKLVGVRATEASPYTLGAVYSCNLSYDEVLFYVLKEDGDNVKLIGSKNLGIPVAYAESSINSEGPVTALSYLNSITVGWIQLDYSLGGVELPNAQDIADAIGDTTWNSSTPTGTKGPDWLRTNLYGNKAPYGYWTSTAWEDFVESAWQVYYNGSLSGQIVSLGTYQGVRPVITVSKEDLLVDDSMIEDN